MSIDLKLIIWVWIWIKNLKTLLIDSRVKHINIWSVNIDKNINISIRIVK